MNADEQVRADALADALLERGAELSAAVAALAEIYAAAAAQRS